MRGLATSRLGSRSLRGLTIAGLIGALLVVGASSAAAQDDADSTDRDQIVFTGSLVVPEGETVDTALIFDGPATIDGTVTETVLVFNGDTEISGTVGQDVVVFNGDVVVRSGAVIEGDLVTQGTAEVEDGATIRGNRTNIVTRFDFDIGIASRFVWWIGISLSMLILGLLLHAFAPGLGDAVRDAVRARMGSSIGWGVALFFLIPIGSVLLLVTVVGIPLGIFFLLALALIYSVGYVVGATGVGAMLVKSPTTSRFVVFLAGWAILRALALIPVVGGLVWLAATAWGLGLFAIAVRSRPAPMAPPPAPPMPVGVA